MSNIPVYSGQTAHVPTGGTGPQYVTISIQPRNPASFTGQPYGTATIEYRSPMSGRMVSETHVIGGYEATLVKVPVGSPIAGELWNGEVRVTPTDNPDYAPSIPRNAPRSIRRIPNAIDGSFGVPSFTVRKEQNPTGTGVPLNGGIRTDVSYPPGYLSSLRFDPNGLDAGYEPVYDADGQFVGVDNVPPGQDARSRTVPRDSRPIDLSYDPALTTQRSLLERYDFRSRELDIGRFSPGMRDLLDDFERNTGVPELQIIAGRARSPLTGALSNAAEDAGLSPPGDMVVISVADLSHPQRMALLDSAIESGAAGIDATDDYITIEVDPQAERGPRGEGLPVPVADQDSWVYDNDTYRDFLTGTDRSREGFAPSRPPPAGGLSDVREIRSPDQFQYAWTDGRRGATASDGREIRSPDQFQYARTDGRRAAVASNGRAIGDNVTPAIRDGFTPPRSTRASGLSDVREIRSPDQFQYAWTGGRRAAVASNSRAIGDNVTPAIRDGFTPPRSTRAGGLFDTRATRSPDQFQYAWTDGRRVAAPLTPEPSRSVSLRGWFSSMEGADYVMPGRASATPRTPSRDVMVDQYRLRADETLGLRSPAEDTMLPRATTSTGTALGSTGSGLMGDIYSGPQLGPHRRAAVAPGPSRLVRPSVAPVRTRPAKTPATATRTSAAPWERQSGVDGSRAFGGKQPSTPNARSQGSFGGKGGGGSILDSIFGNPVNPWETQHGSRAYGGRDQPSTPNARSKSSKGSSGGSGSGGGCFITTAICRSSNLPDDCHELTTLRRFRDEVMRPDPAMQSEIARYYEVAPRIVAGVEATGRADAIWADTRSHYLDPAIRHIEAGDHDKAYTTYRRMVTDLSVFSEA